MMKKWNEAREGGEENGCLCPFMKKEKEKGREKEMCEVPKKETDLAADYHKKKIDLMDKINNFKFPTSFIYSIIFT